MAGWSGRITHPEGSFTRAWLESPPPPTDVSVVGIECDEQGCRSIIVGTSQDEARQRLADHKRRRHG
jgi:hypothetical protein